jgi:hypothetical protein
MQFLIAEAQIMKCDECGGRLMSQSGTRETMCIDCLVRKPERKDETVTIKHQR